MTKGIKQCSVEFCEQQVLSLADRTKSPVFHKTPKHDSTGIWAFPSVPNPDTLCYYHRKKRDGLIGGTHHKARTPTPPSPFWLIEEKLKNLIRKGERR